MNRRVKILILASGAVAVTLLLAVPLLPALDPSIPHLLDDQYPRFGYDTMQIVAAYNGTWRVEEAKAAALAMGWHVNYEAEDQIRGTFDGGVFRVMKSSFNGTWFISLYYPLKEVKAFKQEDLKPHLAAEQPFYEHNVERHVVPFEGLMGGGREP